MTKPNDTDVVETLIHEHHLLMEQYEKACKAEIKALDELRRARDRTNDADLISFLLQNVLQASRLVKNIEERLKSLITRVNTLGNGL